MFGLSEEELGLKGDAPRRDILIALQALFGHLSAADEQHVSTKDLTNSFGWDDGQYRDQHDVQELNRVLMDVHASHSHIHIFWRLRCVL